MGLLSARSKMRTRLVVLCAGTLALTGVALMRSRSAQAHEVITPYPVSCPMVGWAPVFTTTHTPEAGTTPGGTFTLHVKLATPATNNPTMPMNMTMVEFELPKPALVDRITGVTFKAGTGNFTGMTMGDINGPNLALMFMGNASSSNVQLQEFDITAVTKTSAMPGERVSWIGPANFRLGVETCTPTGGAIQYAPTVVLDPNPTTTGPTGGCPTTTMGHSHDDHGDHSHGPTTVCTTTTSTTTTTRRTTTSSSTTTTTRRTTTSSSTTSTTSSSTSTTSTTRPTTTSSSTTTTSTTRPTTTSSTTTTTRTTVPTSMTTTTRPSSFLDLLRRLICRIFRFLC